MTGFLSLIRPLVLRPAAKDRLRFFLTVSGIAVGVATIAAIRLANASVLSSFSDTVDFVAGKAGITVLADGPGIPEAALERLAWLRRAGATLAPAITETAAAGAADGEVVEVLGIDPLADAAAREYSLLPLRTIRQHTTYSGARKAAKIFLEGKRAKTALQRPGRSERHPFHLREEFDPGYFCICKKKQSPARRPAAARHQWQRAHVPRRRRAAAHRRRARGLRLDRVHGPRGRAGGIRKGRTPRPHRRRPAPRPPGRRPRRASRRRSAPRCPPARPPGARSGARRPSIASCARFA